MQPQLWHKLIVNPVAAGYGCFAILAYYAIFSLPYRFPPTQRLASDSYVFGFNNSVAIISTGILLGVATVIRFFHQQRKQHRADATLPYHDVAEDRSGISLFTYGVLALVYLLFTTVIYFGARAVQFYSVDWESSHFLWNLKLMEIYGLRPYIDFKFDYGPALIYPPAYFQRLLSAWSISHEVSYYAFHYLTNLIGLYCIFSLLNRSIMPLAYKNVAFWILGIACLAPYMGLNGIAARFLIPYLSLVIIHQTVARAQKQTLRLRLFKGFFSVFVATGLNISISADIGLAFSIAFVAYTALLCRRDWRELISCLFAFALALALGRILLPAAYYESLFSFAKGANNFPLLPAAHLWLYLVTLFVAVPGLLLAGIPSQHPSGPLVFGLGVLSVALIPGALGRCDPPHVFFYGLGISLIMFVQMANASKKWFLLYATAYICVSIVGLQWSNARWFGVSYKVVASTLGFGDGERNKLNKPRTVDQDQAGNPATHLVALDKYSQLGLPFGNYGTDKITENYLWTQRKIASEYYVGVVGVYTEADLSRKLQDISRNEYLLLLEKFWKFHENSDNCSNRRRYMQLLFIYPVNLPCKREGLDMHLEISKHISSLYRLVETAGDNIVLKRIN